MKIPEALKKELEERKALIKQIRPLAEKLWEKNELIGAFCKENNIGSSYYSHVDIMPLSMSHLGKEYVSIEDLMDDLRCPDNDTEILIKLISDAEIISDDSLEECPICGQKPLMKREKRRRDGSETTVYTISCRRFITHRRCWGKYNKNSVVWNEVACKNRKQAIKSWNDKVKKYGTTDGRPQNGV